jgi:hypothetical protein
MKNKKQVYISDKILNYYVKRERKHLESEHYG